MLFCSVAKAELLVIKSNKSYEFTTWTSITTYKLVEYLVDIHLMLFKKIHVVINVHFMVFKHDIFLCLQFIYCAFCSDLNHENMRDSVQQERKK